jgi:uncharacterized protein YpmB
MPYYIYGHSIRGESHISEGTECQDANKFISCGNGWIVAAVADGVGSAKNSAKGSRIAVDTAVTFVAENMPLSYRENGIKRAIYLGFNAAFKQIMNQAEREHQDLESYDTTLSLVVFNGVNLYYGHSGDGGIFGLTNTGRYVEITKPVKGQDGITVVPLRHGEDTWFIDAYREDLTSVLLVTDGMRDAIKPYALGNNVEDVYVPICSILMYPTLYKNHSNQYRQIIEQYLNGKLSKQDICKLLKLIFNSAIADKINVDQALKSVFETGYAISLIESITDDKTALAIINADSASFPDPQSAIYYGEPDWKKKKQNLDADLYPHLVNDDSKRSEAVKPTEPTWEKPIEDSIPQQTSKPSQKTMQSKKNKSPRCKQQGFGDRRLLSLMKIILFIAILGLFIVIMQLFSQINKPADEALSEHNFTINEYQLTHNI